MNLGDELLARIPAWRRADAISAHTTCRIIQCSHFAQRPYDAEGSKTPRFRDCMGPIGVIAARIRNFKAIPQGDSFEVSDAGRNYAYLWT